MIFASLQKKSGLLAILLMGFIAVSYSAMARDAAFMDPGATGSSASDEAVKVEPKSEIDAGETIIGVARHTNLFFVNQTSVPVQIEKISINGDSNVASELSSDDCSKQQVIAPQSRCSIEVSVTPSSPGAWGVDVLMTHNGPGRITRAKITGKTSGSTANDDKKERGLALSTKEATPVNFGEVEVNGKAVRSALMINDSTENITLYSIDVIEANKGLQRLEQGCAVDMELKPGESCPVTMVWTPQSHESISTDLIIRHSGRLGFAVIPIRGTTKGGEVNAASKDDRSNDMSGKNQIAAPLSKDDIDKMVGKIPASSLTPPVASAVTLPTPAAGAKLSLIGTVGNRAIILKSDQTTTVVGAGDTIEDGTSKISVSAVNAKSIDLMIDGKRKTLPLQTASDLTAKASLQKELAPVAGAVASGIISATPASANPAAVAGGTSVSGAPTPAANSAMTANSAAAKPTFGSPNTGSSPFGASSVQAAASK